MWKMEGKNINFVNSNIHVKDLRITTGGREIK